MNFIVILLLLPLTISSLFVPSVFAYTGYYQSLNQPLLSHTPTACLGPINDSNLPKPVQILFMQTVQDKVLEWSMRLQEGSPYRHAWNINFIQVPSMYSTDGKYFCDIFILLQDIPNDTISSPHNALGFEQYFSTNQRLIVVYYEHYLSCGYPPTYTGFYCATGDYLTVPELSNVVQHELGHAFGLGHYVSDDPNVMNWWSWNLNDAPSIMIPSAEVYPQYQHIQEIDIQQLHNLYNYIGFSHNR